MNRVALFLMLIAGAAGAASFPIPANRTVEDFWRRAYDNGVGEHVGETIYFDGGRILWPNNLNPPTNAAQVDYSASPTNSVTWYSNHLKEISSQDEKLRALAWTTLHAINAGIPGTASDFTTNQWINLYKSYLP